MNKHLLALVVASSLGLTACGDDTKLSGDPTQDPSIGESLKAETKVKFDIVSDPSNPVIVKPTYLAMDSVDGTIKSDGSVGTETYSTDISNPEVAFGKNDGWSTSQPLVIEFTGNTLDATTAAASFFMLETGNPTSADYANVQPVKLSEANGDFKVVASGNKLIVTLLKPLKPSSQYQYAVTSDLKDAKGNPVGMSNSYSILKSTNPTPNIALEPAQQLTHLSEATFAAAGVDKSKIIFSNWFSTASVGKVLDTTKAVLAQTIATVQAGGQPGDIWKGEANPNNVDLTSLYRMDITPVDNIPAFLNNNPALRALVNNDQATLDQLAGAYTTLGLQVFTGTINLPYFLSDETDNQEWMKTPWQSAVPSLAKIKHIMTEGSDADKAAVMTSLQGIDITKLLQGDTVEFIKLIGAKVTLADGSRLDSERLVTQYSPLPQIKSVKQVPIVLIMPANAADAGAVIYQHGITSVKETAFVFAAQHIGAASTAGMTPKTIIAIDHPLHGERALADGTVTTPATASVYMNLQYLNVARDNIRQSIIDDLGVRTSLTIMQAGGHPLFTQMNTQDVSFFGHSLGAISGIGTYRLANQSLGKPEADALFNFTSGAFANPGGGIPSLLLESATFGPTIKHSLLMGAKVDAYVANCGSAGALGGACFNTFYGSLDATTQGTIDALFSEFGYAAQTVLDTVDPYNLAKDVNGPVYVMQAANDSVIPNQTMKFSIMGGTEPLAKQLKLDDLNNYSSGEVRHIARFNSGSLAQHSTVIAPQLVDGAGNPLDPGTAQAATNEAQLEVATFNASGGQGVFVADGTLIQPE